MTATRRTRKSGTTTTTTNSTNTTTTTTTTAAGKRTPKTVNKKVETSDEDESSDSGSITRCVCGQAHNVGLMVQCDECEVWQHCQCMGLSQDKLPKHYYCDQCKPEHHQMIKNSSGRSKRSYNASGLVNNNSPPLITTNSDDEHTNNKKRATKRRKKNDSSPSLLSFTDDTVIPDDTVQSDDLNGGGDPVLIEALPSRKKSPIQEKKSTNHHKKTTNNNHRHHSSTPQMLMLDDFSSPHSSPYWSFVDGRPVRESSPPAKIKYPSPKMTFTDMNKRAKQLMECISKLQAEKSPSPQTTNTPSDEDQENLFNRPRSLSTCSSLSSASTVPLIEDSIITSPSTPIPYLQQHQETSLEMLERVGRELVKFQRKFGIVYQQNESIKNK